jgi:hypothetical protein
VAHGRKISNGTAARIFAVKECAPIAERTKPGEKIQTNPAEENTCVAGLLDDAKQRMAAHRNGTLPLSPQEELTLSRDIFTMQDHLGIKPPPTIGPPPRPEIQEILDQEAAERRKQARGLAGAAAGIFGVPVLISDFLGLPEPVTEAIGQLSGLAMQARGMRRAGAVRGTAKGPPRQTGGSSAIAGPRRAGTFVSPKPPALRQEYMNKVRALQGKVDKMRAEGRSEESIAREIHGDRRALGVEYKDLTPRDMLSEITARNLYRYQDPLGPTIPWLRAKGKTWTQIIESAVRPGGGDLGF